MNSRGISNRSRCASIVHALLCCIVAGLTPNASAEISTSNTSAAIDSALIKSAMKGVVAVYKPGTSVFGKPSGAGFFVTNHGHILTAGHVVLPDTADYDDATFNILDDQFTRARARLVDHHVYYDVALLKIIPSDDSDPTIDFMPLQLADDTTDSKLAVLGHPSDQRAEQFVETQVSVATTSRHGLKTVSPDLESGNSGGPTLDSSGRVVGIALERSNYTATSHVLELSYIRDFLEENGIVIDSHGDGLYRPSSYYAADEHVKLLEKRVDKMKEETAQYLETLSELEKELRRLKSDVSWKVFICAYAEKPAAEGQQPPAEASELFNYQPQRIIEISYDKRGWDDMLYDAEGVFDVLAKPMLLGDTMETARTRLGLAINLPADFDGSKTWAAPDFGDVMSRRVRVYNEDQEEDGKIGMSEIDRVIVTLLPPERMDRMEFFRFDEMVVQYANVEQCQE